MNLIDRINEIAKELELDKIVELSQRVFKDDHPQLDWAYLFAETEENQDSGFQAAAEMKRQELSRTFLVINGEEKHGFPGYAKWQRRLGQLVGYDNVKPVPIGDPSQVNTLSESEALVRYAMEQKQGRLYIVAPPFHLLRAFMTCASATLKTYDQLSIFNYAGVTLPWGEVVTHSQGVLRAPRRELIGYELERIKKYQEKRDILPTQRILDYMDKRNTR